MWAELSLAKYGNRRDYEYNWRKLSKSPPFTCYFGSSNSTELSFSALNYDTINNSYLNDIRCPDLPKPSGLWAMSVSSELLWGEIGQLTYKCSRKKSKCTGERPICSFCERLQLPCKYAARGSSSQDSTTKAQKAQKSDASIIHFHIFCLTEVVGNPPKTGSRSLNRK